MHTRRHKGKAFCQLNFCVFCVLISVVMNQFTVPQFIDVEDKIIGPVTTRQFIIMLAVGLISFVLYKLLAFIPFVISAVVLLGVGATVAFVKINGQPFHFFLLNLLQTWRSPNLQIWDKELTQTQLKEYIKARGAPPKIEKPRKESLTTSRLSEISLTVDTGGVYEPEGS